MRPSVARLKTTFPMAATPVLWPCVRATKLRSSRLPVWPVGERYWGEAHGPRADVLREDSMLRRRRAFTFPWGTRTMEDITTWYVQVTSLRIKLIHHSQIHTYMITGRSLCYSAAVHGFHLLNLLKRWLKCATTVSTTGNYVTEEDFPFKLHILSV